MKILKFIQTLLFAVFLNAAVVYGSAAARSTVSETPPVIFDYINGSDCVVLAELEKTEGVAKFGKKDSNDLQDLMAGFLHTFKIEKTLYAKDSLKPIDSFRVFVTMRQRMNEHYEKGKKYLIFLREIPADENLSTVYELDKEKTYFRAFEGETSIFPYAGGFHGTPKKGIIDLSDTRYKDLVKRIEALTAALNAKDKAAQIENLKALAKSPDEELKANALYAIKILQKEEK